MRTFLRVQAVAALCQEKIQEIVGSGVAAKRVLITEAKFAGAPGCHSTRTSADSQHRFHARDAVSSSAAYPW
jgi:hypothetical protein